MTSQPSFPLWYGQVDGPRPYGLQLVQDPGAPVTGPRAFKKGDGGPPQYRLEPVHGMPVFFLVPPGFDAAPGWHAGRYHDGERCFQEPSTVDREWINCPGPVAYWMPQPMLSVERVQQIYQFLARDVLPRDEWFVALCVEQPQGTVTDRQYAGMTPAQRYTLSQTSNNERKARQTAQQDLWDRLASP